MKGQRILDQYNRCKFKQDKLWELDKSWENNLVFYGVREEQNREESSSLIEAKIREIIKVRLGLTRQAATTIP